MLRNLIMLLLAVAVFWFAVELLMRDREQVAQVPLESQQSPSAVEPLPEAEGSRRVVDISVHTASELETLFNRVEELLERPRSNQEAPLLALVLHGPEVEFFALKNYSQYKSLVDRAAKLAALGAVDISICQTQMRELGIAADEVPGFLRQVPFGPDEVERLVTEGFIYM